jgi:hypothetical protein
MWDTEDQRYDDFLQEDSIINHLRYKNIVSLVSEYQVTLDSLPPSFIFHCELHYTIDDPY